MAGFDDYTDGYALSVVSTMLVTLEIPDNTNMGFCFFNELYAECLNMYTNSIGTHTFGTYVFPNGVNNEFFIDLLEANPGEGITKTKLDFQNDDLAVEQGWQSSLASGVGRYQTWNATVGFHGPFIEIRAHRYLPKEK